MLAAEKLHETLTNSLERTFGEVMANPPMPQTAKDTGPSYYTIGGKVVRIQLLNGRDYPAWPTQTSQVSQRHAGLPDVSLRTYTPAAFTAAKTLAWSDSTRNAPRDLYDLWALAEMGPHHHRSSGPLQKARTNRPQ